MYRTPVRREPRVAALIRSGRHLALVVLDAWEVRAAIIARSPAVIRRALLRERPDAIAARRAPPWLRRVGARVVTRRAARARPDLAAVPELRRFAAQPYGAAVLAAAALADELLTTLVHDQRLPQN